MARADNNSQENFNTLAINTVSTPVTKTYGTTAPVLSVPVGNSGRQTIFCDTGIVFSTACSVAVALANGGTGASGDGNPTAPSYTVFGGE